MQIIHNTQDLKISSACVTIGNFDGVHIGHQALMTRTLDLAKTYNLQSLGITFWPHPRSVVTPEKKHCPLTTRDKRFELLERLGLEVVLELNFTHKLTLLSPEEFVKNYLVPLNTKMLVTGYDFCLGRNRSGHTAELRKLGTRYGFEVEQLSPLYLEDKIVSSTRLRTLIKEGELDQAQKLLGRYYTLTGEVTTGCGRGRILGFPTANLSNIATLLPASGVYAIYARVGDDIFQAVANIGHNPTFGDNPLSIEAFLLDTSLDLYGKKLEIIFIKRLRSEQAFPNQEQLITQIKKDVDQAKFIFSSIKLELKSF